MVKLALILDKSAAVLSLEKDNLLASWGHKDPNLVRLIASPRQAAATSLFGETFANLIRLEDADSVRRVLAVLEEWTANGNLECNLGDGLILMGSVQRNSTKKLEALVSKVGGALVMPSAEAAKEKVSPAVKLLGDLNLNRWTRNFLLDYIGDDYALAVPLLRGLEELSPEAQGRLTVEDMVMRMPQPPGSIPPWELEKPLMAGKVTETVETFRRIVAHSHPLVVLKVLTGKFQTMYRTAALLENQPSLSQAAVAASLGVPDNYGLKLAMGNAKRLGRAKTETAVLLLNQLEDSMKGGTWLSGRNTVPGAQEMEIVLVKLLELVR